jgi:hypothetical protein
MRMLGIVAALALLSSSAFGMRPAADGTLTRTQGLIWTPKQMCYATTMCTGSVTMPPACKVTGDPCYWGPGQSNPIMNYICGNRGNGGDDSMQCRTLTTVPCITWYNGNCVRAGTTMWFNCDGTTMTLQTSGTRTNCEAKSYP